MKIYAISGLGADQRVFQYLKLENEIAPIDWITPEKNESIENYAKRLSAVINTKEDFVLLGVSFGGLIAVEISKISNPVTTILISSAETKNELPKKFRMFGKGLLNLLPKRFFDIPRKPAQLLFGTKEVKLLNDILDDTDLYFAKWAVNQLVNWQNTSRLNSVLKISGEKDKVIPPSNTENESLIKGGEHFMIVDRADEIIEIINFHLKGESENKKKKNILGLRP